MKASVKASRPGKTSPHASAERSALSHDQAILDSLDARIALLDENGTIAVVNKSWRLFSQKRHCFWIGGMRPGVNYLTACKKAKGSGIELASAAAAVLKGAMRRFSRDYACSRSGTEEWYLVSVTRLSDPVPGAVVSCTEITDQRRAIEAQAQFSSIVESSTDAISAINLKGTVISWNKAAEDIYGYSAKEIIGRPLSTIVPRDRLRELHRTIRKIEAGLKAEPFETLRRRKDGRVIPVAVTVSAVRNSQGEIIGISGIARDVSERRRMEREVLHAAEREQRRIANDLHDGLTQQIAGVACLATALQQTLEQEKSPHAAEALSISNLLSDAGEQTRDLARGLYPVRPQPEGLMAALDALAARTSELFHLECLFHYHNTTRVKDVNVANHLYRIAQEAVSNAVRHAHAQRIEIRLSRNENQLVLGVSDDGTGIAARRRSTKGIGMRIMAYRADLISGTLVIAPRPGGGTEVVCAVNRRNHGEGE